MRISGSLRVREVAHLGLPPMVIQNRGPEFEGVLVARSSQNMSRGGRSVKLVLLGDAGVGKSSIAQRFVTDTFKPFNESTVGASFMSKIVKIDGTSYKFMIWDTAGQEKYRSLAPMYYKGAAAAVLVFDITKAATFDQLKSWVNELRMHGPEDILITIAANKADLGERREVSAEIALEFAESVNAAFVETSAKDDTGISSLFTDLGRRIPEPAEPRQRGDSLNLGRSSATESGGCC